MQFEDALLSLTRNGQVRLTKSQRSQRRHCSLQGSEDGTGHGEIGQTDRGHSVQSFTSASLFFILFLKLAFLITPIAKNPHWRGEPSDAGFNATAPMASEEDTAQSGRSALRLTCNPDDIYCKRLQDEYLACARLQTSQPGFHRRQGKLCFC